jgi:cytochrome c5
VRRVSISFISLSASLLLLACSPAALGASGAEVYKVKCALCHDSGATNAPRSGRPADWTRRADKGFAGLMRSAMQGVPSTAMLPKAGFPELTETEIADAVRYMLASAGLPPDLPARAAAPEAPLPGAGASFEARVDDAKLSLSVAEALILARIGGVQIEARNGRVVLKGVVDDAAAAARALRATKAVAGVREVESRLVSADIFEHD